MTSGQLQFLDNEHHVAMVATYMPRETAHSASRRAESMRTRTHTVQSGHLNFQGQNYSRCIPQNNLTRESIRSTPNQSQISHPTPCPNMRLHSRVCVVPATRGVKDKALRGKINRRTRHCSWREGNTWCPQWCDGYGEPARQSI